METIEDIDKRIDALEEKERVTVAGGDYYRGYLRGTPAVVVQCGVGKVNAARCTQALIDRFSPRAVINSGIAGGVGEGDGRVASEDGAGGPQVGDGFAVAQRVKFAAYCASCAEAS